MTKKQSILFRLVILCFGLVIFAITLTLATNGRELSGAEKFLWLTIGLDYLIFFIPVFFNGVTFKNFAGRTIPIVLLWNATIIFCLVSLALSVLVFYGKVPITVAVVIDLVMLFLALILIFISVSASDHVESVGQNEEKLLSSIKGLRSESQILATKVASNEKINTADKKLIEKISQDIRFLSPVNNAKAFDAENKILQNILRLSEICSNIESGTVTSDFTKLANETKEMIAQRKLLLN